MIPCIITHCPPKYGLQGVVLENNWNYMNDFGCVELQQVLDELFADKGYVGTFGHIHSGKANESKKNGNNVRVSVTVNSKMRIIQLLSTI